MVELHDRTLAVVGPPVEVEADRVDGVGAPKLNEARSEQRRVEEPVAKHGTCTQERRPTPDGYFGRAARRPLVLTRAANWAYQPVLCLLSVQPPR